MTLLEVLVVLAVLGLVTAVVLPSLVVPETEPTGIGQVVRRTRALAITRAQTLRLNVTSDGRWVVRDEALAIDSGAIATPGQLELWFSPGGRCRLATALPAAWAAWDVTRCRATERNA
ncbi:MAG: hypothetical protein IPK85_10075 [Gemmatimonadetes bacterium]|nr:hypothetical protein [Gemmatimonadota bacterium]